jgi:hypothetical protein
MLEDSHLTPDDLRRAARLCRETLAPGLGADWTARAGDLEWTCRRTLDHLADALALYALHLAVRAGERKPAPRNGDPALAVAELFDVVEGLAAVLAEVATAAPAAARGFHGAGMADAEGFLAMGCEELLIHTDDIAQGLGLPFQPPPALTARVLHRLFPWAPTGHDPWQTVRWASGRIALPGHPRLGPDWYWHCAPLAEWDGRVRRRTAPPAWR